MCEHRVQRFLKWKYAPGPGLRQLLLANRYTRHHSMSRARIDLTPNREKRLKKEGGRDRGDRVGGSGSVAKVEGVWVSGTPESGCDAL